MPFWDSAVPAQAEPRGCRADQTEEHRPRFHFGTWRLRVGVEVDDEEAGVLEGQEDAWDLAFPARCEM